MRLLLVLCCTLLPFVLSAQIIQNLGPNRNGIFKETGLLKEWPAEGPKKVLQINNIGKGWSAPISVDNKILATGMIDSLDYISAYNFDGELLWRSAFGKSWHRTYPDTRSTPTIEGDKTWVVSGTGNLACFNLNDGKEIWAVNVDQKFNATQDIWGTAESPLIIDDMVISMPAGEQTSMVALNKNTGETIWETKSVGGNRSYTSPVVYKNGSVRLILGMTADIFFAVDPSNGDIAWTFPFRERGTELENNRNKWTIYANNPIVIGNKVFLSAGWNYGSILFEIAEDGKSVQERWLNRDLDNQQYGVIEYKGFIYGSNWINLKKGNWMCVNVETGITNWETTHHNKGIIISADNMFYTYDEEGNVCLIEPSSKELKVISEFKITEGESFHWAHPFIANGKLFIRHGNALMVYQIK